MSDSILKIRLILLSALREISGNRGFAVFFTLNLSMGFLGFLGLYQFKILFAAHLEAQSQAMIGGDIVVSARRVFSNDEQNLIRSHLPKDTQSFEMIEIYSMVRHKTSSRLYQIRATPSNFPLRGVLKLRNSGAVTSESPKSVSTGRNIWVTPEFLIQMGARLGDRVQIGDLEFTIDDEILDDLGGGIGRMPFASRIYMSSESLSATGLVQFGSTMTVSLIFRVNNDFDADELSNKINDAIGDPAVEAKSHKLAAQQNARTIHYLSDYLSLVAITGLFLSGIGASFLVRRFLSSRVKDMAVYQILGFTPLQIKCVYLISVAIMGVASATLAGIVMTALMSQFDFLNEYFALSLESGISLSQTNLILRAALMGLLVAMVVALPLLQTLRNFQLTQLLRQGAEEDGSATLRVRELVWWLPAFILFWFLSVEQSHSWRVGSLFSFSFLASAIGLSLFGVFVLNSLVPLLLKILNPRYTILRMSLRSLSRNKLATATGFMALGLGSLLMNLVPQLQVELRTELENPETALPSLFLFDVQETQLSSLKETFGISKSLQFFPLVRARLMDVNGKPFEKAMSNSESMSREEEREVRFRNRGFNLTYRQVLLPSESIVEGRAFSNERKALAEVSIEAAFADRLGFELGDVLNFDVMGEQVMGQIVNFRKVRWSSFQPNFFVVFQDGFLAEFPKTYLGSVSELKGGEKDQTQFKVASIFPNISVIDVESLVGSILKFTAKMVFALETMAWMSLLAGLVTLFSIANHQAYARRRELSLLKVLGASFRQILSMIVVEFGLLCLVSSLAGVTLSLGVVYALSMYILSGHVTYSFNLLSLNVALTVTLGILVTLIASWQSLQSKPQDLLSRSQ